jgi:hypothetical protein
MQVSAGLRTTSIAVIPGLFPPVLLHYCHYGQTSRYREIKEQSQTYIANVTY